MRGWPGGTQFFLCSVFCHPAPIKYCWKWEICQVAKPWIVMLEAPVFWITYSCVPEKLMPPDKADFAQTNGFKAFPGTRQANPLIQSKYPADFRFFPTKQSGYSCRMPSSDSSPPLLALWRTVTARVPVLSPVSERCTMQWVFRLVEPMWNSGISLPIRRYRQGRKVCRLKGLCRQRRHKPRNTHRQSRWVNLTWHNFPCYSEMCYAFIYIYKFHNIAKMGDALWLIVATEHLPLCVFT